MSNPYALSRGGWFQLVPVTLGALLAYGLVRAALQIEACTGTLPRLHLLLAALCAVPVLMPVLSEQRWRNGWVGLAWLAALMIYLGVKAPLGDILSLLPACPTP